VEEEEVEPVVHAVDGHALLASHECEVGSQFGDESLQFPEDRLFEIPLVVGVLQAEEVEEVRIAEDEVRGHPVPLAQ
jgi:hypothetical protein